MFSTFVKPKGNSPLPFTIHILLLSPKDPHAHHWVCDQSPFYQFPIGSMLALDAKPCSIGKILGYILLSSPSVKDVAPLASIVPFLLICCIAINAVNLLLVFNLILLSVLTPFLLALFGTFCFTTAAMSTLSLFYNISIVICLVAFGMRVVSAPFGKLPMVYCKGTLLVWLFWIACSPPYFVTSLPLRIFLFMHLLMILLLFLLHGKCCTKHISAFSILVNVPILFLIHPSVNYGIKEFLVVITHQLLTTSASAFTPFSLALLSMLVYPTLTLLNILMAIHLLMARHEASKVLQSTPRTPPLLLSSHPSQPISLSNEVSPVSVQSSQSG